MDLLVLFWTSISNKYLSSHSLINDSKLIGGRRSRGPPASPGLRNNHDDDDTTTTTNNNNNNSVCVHIYIYMYISVIHVTYIYIYIYIYISEGWMRRFQLSPIQVPGSRQPSSSPDFSIRAFSVLSPCRIQTSSSRSSKSSRQHLHRQHPPLPS